MGDKLSKTGWYSGRASLRIDDSAVLAENTLYGLQYGNQTLRGIRVVLITPAINTPRSTTPGKETSWDRPIHQGIGISFCVARRGIVIRGALATRLSPCWFQLFLYLAYGDHACTRLQIRASSTSAWRRCLSIAREKRGFGLGWVGLRSGIAPCSFESFRGQALTRYVKSGSAVRELCMWPPWSRRLPTMKKTRAFLRSSKGLATSIDHG